MKTLSSRFITAGLVAALVSPAFAVEAPEDDAPPPVTRDDAAGLPVIPLPGQAKPAKAPAGFLGVISGEIPEMLADHLSLGEGEGIVVRSLVPEGPAEKSGIALNDVILKVGGEPVGTPAEIAKQVAGRVPGDVITLDVIHKGKPGKVDVTLGTKPAELAAAELQPLQQLDMDGLPRELAQRVRDAIAGNIGGMDLQQGRLQGAQIPPDMEQALRELQNRVQAMGGHLQMQPGQPGIHTETRTHGESTVRMSDDEGSVEVKSTDGAKQVTVRDQQDKVVWSGPWDTAQDKAAAPAGVKSRVDTLNLETDAKGGGLRFRMTPQAQPGGGKVLPPAPPLPGGE